MNRVFFRLLAVALCFPVCVTLAASQDSQKLPLRLAQTISLPAVKGRLDHMEVDVQRQRLFVAGLENGTFEVVDLKAGKWMCSVPEFKKPQGALFVREFNKLFLASGDDGMVRVFRGDTLQLLDSIQFEPGPNRIVYEPNSKLVYVGYGARMQERIMGKLESSTQRIINTSATSR